METANEKTDKKAVFSPYCGDETTTNYNRAILNLFATKKKPCHSIDCFYFRIVLRVEPFSPVFPPMDSMIGVFYGAFLWNFKK